MTRESADQEASVARPEAGLSKFASTLVLVGIFLALLMGSMDALVVATVLPTIAGDLHQVSGITFVAGAYLIASAISIPILSRLSDISSRRNVFVFGLGLFIVGSALAGVSQNLTELIAFRALQGFGGGGVFPVALAMVAVMFPPSSRSRIIGILTGASGLSIVLGPLVGSYIVAVTTWRWVFYINLPFGVMAMVVTMFALKPLRPDTRGRFDSLGAGMLTGWVGALMVALVEVADEGVAWADPLVVSLLSSSVVLFGAFVWWERRVMDPLIPLNVLANRSVTAASGVFFFTGIVFSALFTFLSVFVGIVLLHNGPDAAGDIRDMIYFMAIPMIIGAAASGQILTRLSYRKVIAPGLAVAAIAGLLLAQLSTSTPLWVFALGIIPVGGIALPLIPIGLGMGFSLAGPTVAVQNDAPKEDVGVAVGLLKFLQTLGGALGISLLTTYQADRFAALSSGVAAGQVTSALVTSYDDVFLILALCVFVAFGFSMLFVGRQPQSNGAE
jgi:EmrB/QacA subfamily drug resistance transporter